MAGQANTVEFHEVNSLLPWGKKLLADFNLQVARGKTLVLLGRGDLGKSTGMQSISQLHD